MWETTHSDRDWLISEFCFYTAWLELNWPTRIQIRDSQKSDNIECHFGAWLRPFFLFVVVFTTVNKLPDGPSVHSQRQSTECMLSFHQCLPPHNRISDGKYWTCLTSMISDLGSSDCLLSRSGRVKPLQTHLTPPEKLARSFLEPADNLFFADFRPERGIRPKKIDQIISRFVPSSCSWKKTRELLFPSRTKTKKTSEMRSYAERPPSLHHVASPSVLSLLAPSAPVFEQHSATVSYTTHSHWQYAIILRQKKKEKREKTGTPFLACCRLQSIL